MKKTYMLFMVLVFVCSFGIYAFAEDTPEIYNKGKKVEIENTLIYNDGQYFIHSDDLKMLNVSYSYDEETKNGEITTNDCLGLERRISFSLADIITIVPTSPGDSEIIIPIDPDDLGTVASVEPDNSEGIKSVDPEEFIIPVLPNDFIYDLSSDKPGKIYSYRMDISDYSKKDAVKIGETNHSLDDEYDIRLIYKNIIKLDGEYYFPLDFIGETMSHKYSFDGEKFELYIADKDGVIVENCVHLSGVAATTETGWPISISFFEDCAQSNNAPNGESLYEISYITQPGEKEIGFMADIPKEKIVDNTFFYRIDLGERYTVLESEYDFSEIGIVKAYPYQKDIKAKIKISLPEPDESDVLFRAGIHLGRTYYEQSGVIRSGELSGIVEISDVPSDTTYMFYVVFDTNKYIDENFDTLWLNEKLRSDIYKEYTARKSTEVRCKLSLPQGFVCKEDVKVTVALGAPDSAGIHIQVNDRLENGNDRVDIVLNSSTPVKEVVLYGTGNPLMLYYELDKDMPGLKKSGYLSESGWEEKKENYILKNKYDQITENKTVEFSLMENREIVISKKEEAFIFEKTNVNFNALCDIYIAYYDEDEALVWVEKKDFGTESSVTYPYSLSDSNIKLVKAFVWGKESLVPFGKAEKVEILVPMCK